MALEDWIDTLCDVWAIEDGKGGTVKAYHYYDKAEFPASLTVFPCAVTIPQSCLPRYSTGGPLIDYWRGVTEFHLSEGLDYSLIPWAALFVKRIRNAAALNISLGGRVPHFMIRQDIEDAVRGPTQMRWSEDQPWHWGILVQWEVKDNETYSLETQGSAPIQMEG